ncbi:MAG: hypothetical protein ACYC35_23435 [Pirellulales bacterium]
MQLNCLSCGHRLDMRDSYDDYQGPVRCFICGALMTIRSEDGQMKWAELEQPADSKESHVGGAK